MIVHPIYLLDTPCQNPTQALRLLQTSLSCGFTSPAGDYLESLPSLDELLIKHPSETFVGRASGESMIERGILDGSLLIIDRSITPSHNETIVASIGGELTIKILDLKNRQLKPANAKQKPIPLPEDLEVICEGVVTYCITPQQNYAFAC